MLICSMSVSVAGFINDREGAFGWTAPSEELFRFHIAEVIGLSDRWRTEGIRHTRVAVAVGAEVPTLFVRRGLRPGGVAPSETLTRFTWTLGSEPILPPEP